MTWCVSTSTHRLFYMCDAYALHVHVRTLPRAYVRHRPTSTDHVHDIHRVFFLGNTMIPSIGWVRMELRDINTMLVSQASIDRHLHLEQAGHL
jgi:hypothetical protein